MATALSIGKCTVTHKSESVSTYSLSLVVLVTRISVDLTNVPFVSNYRGLEKHEPSSYFVPVSFYGGETAATAVELLDTAAISQNIEYTCTIEETAFAVASPELQAVTNKRGCRITVFSPLRIKGQEGATKSAITLVVGVVHESQVAQSIPYYPAIWVTSTAGSPIEYLRLGLTRSADVVLVTHGSSRPVVRSLDPSLVAVTPVATAGNYNPGATSYEISVVQRRRPFAGVVVEFWVEQTLQKVWWHDSHSHKRTR